MVAVGDRVCTPTQPSTHASESFASCTYTTYTRTHAHTHTHTHTYTHTHTHAHTRTHTRTERCHGDWHVQQSHQKIRQSIQTWPTPSAQPQRSLIMYCSVVQWIAVCCWKRAVVVLRHMRMTIQLMMKEQFPMKCPQT